jgi:hypothetical protein
MNDAIKKRLEEIAERNHGLLTPSAVVADAKRKDSPLHGCFTWDVRKAAEAHWLDQARALIASVTITVHTETTRIKAVAYVRDPASPPGTQGYRSVKELRSDTDLAREALVNEFTRVADLLRRARDLAVALDAASEVELLLQSVVGLRQRFSGEAGDAAVQ